MSDRDQTFEARVDEALDQLRESVLAAVDAAHEAFAAAVAAHGRGEPPPRAFFASQVMQLGYCLQCGADPERFTGGDREAAWYAVKNAVDIANHHWGAGFEVRRV